jgi:hypothetical protein
MPRRSSIGNYAVAGQITSASLIVFERPEEAISEPFFERFARIAATIFNRKFQVTPCCDQKGN